MDEGTIQPEWCRKLYYQQQSVLLLAARGPDGIAKRHPCKAVVIAYRGTVLKAAMYGRQLRWGERADSFMSLDRFANTALWADDISTFFDHYDALPKHYLAHLMHGAQIVGYKHPDERFRDRWGAFYLELVDSLHLLPESEAQMDRRLCDWDRRHWDTP